MSIGTKVDKAIESLNAKDPEEALYQICSAIEPTAKVEFGKGGGSAYKEFIDKNLSFITRVAFGGSSIKSLNLQFYHADLKPNADGVVPIQDIFYHVVRCGLFHEARLPDNLIFSEKQVIKIDDSGVLTLPAGLILGLILAVIVSPANSSEETAEDCAVGFGILLTPIPVNSIWGHRHEITWLLDLADDVSRLAKKQQRE